MVQDVLVERTGGEILRIAADELLLILRGVGEIDEVVNDIDEAILAEEAGNHCLQRVDAVAALVFGIHLAPGVEELVGCVERAELVVHAIGDDNESGVFEQCWDVPAVANGELLVCIFDGGILLESVLELKHDHGQAVEEDDGIGDAALVTHNVELVHHLEDVVLLVGFVESDGIDIEVLLGRVFALQREAVHQQVEGLLVFGVEGAAVFLHDDTDGRLDFRIRDAVVLVAVAQILGEVVAQHHFI